jgi:hypothetical protein
MGMGRGGKRKGAGRHSRWKHSDTQAIRVPKAFAQQLLNIAMQLDEGVTIEVIQKPKVEIEPTEPYEDLNTVPGQLSLLDFSNTQSSSGKPSDPVSQFSHGITGRELARRLDISSGTLQKYKNRNNFAQWSCSHDPDNLEWLYDSKNKLFYPIEF